MTLTAPRPTETRGRARSVLARAFGITAVMSAGGSLLGLLRDLLLARYFGAGRGTDAFLVSWTVPETAAPLLIEDAMAFLMVPAFSLALSADTETAQQPPQVPTPRSRLVRASENVPAAPSHAAPKGRGELRDQPPTPRTPALPPAVADLVGATLPPLALLLAAVSAATLLGAPFLVHLLAPGLADPALAVVCTRLTALTILPFGLTGYLSAGLRAHRRFTAPGAVYIAYNTGILLLMVLLHGSLGVRAAAAGVALGSVLMTAVLLPPFTRHCARLTPRRRPQTAASPALVLSPLALLPIALFTLTRQSQVFVERYLASSLAPGTISHLNYAEKVAQMAMTLGVLVCTVTFPVIARALADGDLEAARERVQKDLALIGALVLAGTAVLMACAPQIVALLFQRGAFTAQDTAATGSVMRVYSLGLLGQAMVGALVRPFFSTRPVVAFGTAPARSGSRSDWFPLAAMALGLLVTTTIGLAAVARHGAIGLAAANATGITLTAVLLLVGIRTRGVALRLRTVLLDQARLLLAAALAAAAAYTAAQPFAAHALPSVLLGAAAGVAAFVLAAAALRAPVVTGPLAALTARLWTRGRKDEGEGRHGG
ncbi:murein biosynthesis integral membrane protein MurJ [Streptacidiphilus sp. EB103A]|uniref:murein biosynthesis integral membrane protein MurJ n=1 Tax=Streptacidiphilus sp. EB103A TaxID=3156275 RepID=UPI0035127E12